MLIIPATENRNDLPEEAAMDIQPYQRIMVSLPPEMVANLDAVARRQMTSRAAIIRWAIQEKLVKSGGSP